MQREIVLPETKPETEWVRGRALQKVSPTYRHGLAQRLIGAALGNWADEIDAGRVATEWRFRVTPPGAVTRPLVPDVAFLSYDDLARDASEEDVAVPRVAPTVAVEILSPDDRTADVADKIAVYLASGTRAVIVVDPQRRSASIHDTNASRDVGPDDALEHPALPGFRFRLAALADP